MAPNTNDDWARAAVQFLIWRACMNAAHTLEEVARRLREAAK
jgi:hypothetical protein